ncbi:hypothetical protein MBRA_06342 [Methylobacterium brachiatum]|nr:hypothetical protein MBRA_06342 [Methylobacterium brachiatum]
MTHAQIPDFSVSHLLSAPGVFPVPSPDDPVLVAIDAHADAWAVYQLAPAGHFAEAAEDALSVALEDLLATPCLTRFGALALVRHLRWLIREAAITAESDDLMERFTVAREADLSRFVGSDLPPEYLPQAAPLGRLAAQVVRRLPPTPPVTPVLAAARASSSEAVARGLGTMGEILAAVVIIGGGMVLTGLATLL